MESKKYYHCVPYLRRLFLIRILILQEATTFPPIHNKYLYEISALMDINILKQHNHDLHVTLE